MAKWLWVVRSRAEKDLAGLDITSRRRIIEKLDWLVDNFDKILPPSLTHNLRDFYKLRVGNWRIFYQTNWDKKILFICYIDRRDKAYKK